MISGSDHWLGVELRHLAALQAVAREGSFRRAAVSLGYTQSAVSQQIATLERIVGEQLIERPGGPRRVSLTEAGAMLLRHAEVILARLRAAQADLAGLTCGASGALRVGTYQSVGRRVLPELLQAFTIAWPRIDIQLTESANDMALLPLIERGDLDLTFCVYPLPAGPFESVELMRDPYVLVVSFDSPLACPERRPTFADLTGVPLIGFRQCRSVTHMEEHLRSRGIEPRIVFRSDDNGTLLAMVAAGMGIALVPRLTIEPDARIAVVELDEDIPARRIALAWHCDRYRTPAARAFVDLTRSICRELEHAGLTTPAVDDALIDDSMAGRIGA